MNKGETHSNRLVVWGDSTLNKLPGASRKRRKRHTSKRRRVQLKRQDLHDE